jgi:hypothetical protein
MDDLFANFNETMPWGQTLELSIDARDIHLKSDRMKPISHVKVKNSFRQYRRTLFSLPALIFYSLGTGDRGSVFLFLKAKYICLFISSSE